MPHVRALEGKDRNGRRQAVIAVLGSLGITPSLQQRRWPRLTNIVVDLGEQGAPYTIFSAHYDAVKGSPGANDNASGVAVLLGLCSELRLARRPVRVIFFDREEAWLRLPFLRLGLLGSLHYAWRTDLSGAAAAYNVDMCGAGVYLGIWPVRGVEAARMPAVAAARHAASIAGIESGLAHVPWYILSSDHLPFRMRGLTSAVTLSLLPQKSVPQMEALLRRPGFKLWLSGGHHSLPEPFSVAHTADDTSSRAREESLQAMLSVLLALAN